MTNEEKVKAVLSYIEEGMSENAACQKANISRSTFRTTALRVQSGDSYARALFGLAHDQVEKLEQTIQDMRDGKLDPQIGRIEVDARKWFASKFLPKQFGEKVALTGGDENDAPIKTVTRIELVAPGNDGEG